MWGGGGVGRWRRRRHERGYDASEGVDEEQAGGVVGVAGDRQLSSVQGVVVERAQSPLRRAAKLRKCRDSVPRWITTTTTLCAAMILL
jgi:primosomal protein N'